MADFPIRSIPTQKTYATATVTTSTDGLSNVIDLGGHTVNSIQMSTAWTAANLTFAGSVNSSAEMMTVRHTTACTELTYATTDNYQVTVDPYLLSGLRYLQVRSGTAGTPVAQAAERVLILGLTPVNPIK